MTYDDFSKIEIKIGRINEAVPHPNADKLMVLQVDLGEETLRQIVAGIKAYYSPTELVGKQIAVVTNLDPVMLRGVQSNGMLLASKDATTLALLTPDKEITSGSGVK